MNETAQKNSCSFFSGVSIAVSWSSPIPQQADPARESPAMSMSKSAQNAKKTGNMIEEVKKRIAVEKGKTKHKHKAG